MILEVAGICYIRSKVPKYASLLKQARCIDAAAGLLKVQLHALLLSIQQTPRTPNSSPWPFADDRCERCIRRVCCIPAALGFRDSRLRVGCFAGCAGWVVAWLWPSPTIRRGEPRDRKASGPLFSALNAKDSVGGFNTLPGAWAEP